MDKFENSGKECRRAITAERQFLRVDAPESRLDLLAGKTRADWLFEPRLK